MLVLFVPIVRFLVRGASSLEVPMRVLVTSVVAFLVVPLAVGVALRAWAIARRGKAWLEGTLLPRLAPVTVAALLLTLVAIFAFQADNVLRQAAPRRAHRGPDPPAGRTSTPRSPTAS